MLLLAASGWLSTFTFWLLCLVSLQVVVGFAGCVCYCSGSANCFLGAVLAIALGCSFWRL